MLYSGFMNTDTRTLTLNLSSAEMLALDRLSKAKRLSKTALLRQALRLYEMVEMRLEAGERIFFENEKSEKAHLLLV